MSIEVMKQALAKFESLWEIGIDAVYRVELLPEIQALRQAIEQAEKQEPVAWIIRDSIDGSWYPCAFENPAGAIKGESKPLYAVPQQAEKQEPVGWFDWDAKREIWVQVYPNTHGQPLYALKEKNGGN